MRRKLLPEYWKLRDSSRERRISSGSAHTAILPTALRAQGKRRSPSIAPVGAAERGLQKPGDGFGQRAGMVGARHGQRLLALDGPPGHAVDLKEPRLAAKRLLRQNRVSETSLHQPLDRNRVISFNDNLRGQRQIAEEAVDHRAHIAALGIEQELRRGQLGGADRADMPAADPP